MMIYVLAYSELYTCGDYVIYEGNIGSQYHKILSRKELVLSPYYVFKNSKASAFFEKTLFWTDKGLFLLGGASFNNQRTDYLI